MCFILMENNFVLPFFFPTFNSLEYDENTSIIFRPNAKVMQCHLNLLFYMPVICV